MNLFQIWAKPYKSQCQILSKVTTPVHTQQNIQNNSQMLKDKIHEEHIMINLWPAQFKTVMVDIKEPWTEGRGSRISPSSPIKFHTIYIKNIWKSHKWQWKRQMKLHDLCSLITVFVVVVVVVVFLLVVDANLLYKELKMERSSQNSIPWYMTSHPVRCVAMKHLMMGGGVFICYLVSSMTFPWILYEL